MENIEQLTLTEMKEFVTNNKHVNCTAVDKEAIYGFIERVLKEQKYRRLSKGQKGIVKRFLCKLTGVSRAQLTRLTARWMEHRKIERSPARRPSFPRHYTVTDIAQLAEVDEAHEDLSGPAVRHLLKREFEEFGNKKFERLRRFRRRTFITCAGRRTTPKSASGSNIPKHGK